MASGLERRFYGWSEGNLLRLEFEFELEFI